MSGMKMCKFALLDKKDHVPGVPRQKVSSLSTDICGWNWFGVSAKSDAFGTERAEASTGLKNSVICQREEQKHLISLFLSYFWHCFTGILQQIMKFTVQKGS